MYINTGPILVYTFGVFLETRRRRASRRVIGTSVVAFSAGLVLLGLAAAGAAILVVTLGRSAFPYSSKNP